jgi:hypothetical protein
MQITREFSKYQIIPVTFGQANVAASQADVQLKDVTGGVEGVTMAFPGIIVGLTIDLSAASTGGQLTVGVTINGTEVAATTQTITTATAVRAIFDRDAVKFAAGDKLGVEITTNAGWTPETAELAATVLAALAVSGI